MRAWLPVALAGSGFVVRLGGDPGVLALASVGVGVFLLMRVWAGLAARARTVVALGVPLERCYEPPSAELTLALGRDDALAPCRGATSGGARSRAFEDGPDSVRAEVALDAVTSVSLRLRVAEIAPGRSRVTITGAHNPSRVLARGFGIRFPLDQGRSWKAVLDVERWLGEHGPVEAAP